MPSTITMVEQTFDKLLGKLPSLRSGTTEIISARELHNCQVVAGSCHLWVWTKDTLR